MIQNTPQDLIAIITNLLTLSAAIGLLLGLIFQPRRERANWYFALFLTVLALWAYAALIMRVPELSVLPGQTHSVYLRLSSLGLVPVAFYQAAITFCRIQARPARILGWMALPLSLLFLALLWSNQIAVVPEENLPPEVSFNTGPAPFDLRPIGYLALAFMILYFMAAY